MEHIQGFFPSHPNSPFFSLHAKHQTPLRSIMAATSSMFLTLTPPMQDMDKISHNPKPIDHITLNLAVESLSYHLVSGDTLGPLFNSLKAASLESSASVSPNSGTTPYKNKAGQSDAGDSLTESFSTLSEEKHIDSPTSPTSLIDRQETVVATLPTEFLSPATVLKRRLESTKDLIVCPGVYDGFSARIALSVGFDALYMVSNAPRQALNQPGSHHSDRCRHNSLSPRPTGPRPRTAQ